MNTTERLIAQTASGQYGLLSRQQLLTAGVTDEQIRSRLRNGRLAGVHPGVYEISGIPDSWRRQLLGAVLASGPAATVSHRAAGQRWGLDGRVDDLIELTVPHSRQPVVSGVILHRTKRWFAPDLSRRAGIPVTSAARTLLDLGAVARPIAVKKALESALRKRLVTVPLLRWRLAEAGGRGCPGVGILRTILDERPPGGPAGSGLEVVALDLIRRHELPLPETQVEVLVNGRIYYIDMGYRPVKLGLEIDGFETHGTPEALVSDLRRQNDLIEAGWTLLRFSFEDVVNGSDQVAARILRQLTTLGFFAADER